MKQAIIEVGSKQYLVAVGDRLAIDLVDEAATKSPLTYRPLIVIDEQKVSIGQPHVSAMTVRAKIVEAVVKADKVVSIRFKAKKRVHKRRGHRQRHTIIEITAIGSNRAKTTESSG